MLNVWRLRGLHTGGSGSQTGSGQTYLSPRVLGFQVGDMMAMDLAHAASLTAIGILKLEAPNP